MTADDRGRVRQGVAAMIGACVIWGLSPLYYRLLSQLPPADILAHRIVWSLAFFAAYLAVKGRLGEVRDAVTDRTQAGWILVASAMITVNWFLFIFAIQVDRVTETSLGYYMFPLVSVLFGALVFGERLAALQWTAVTVAAIAVGILTFGLGAAPWISLVLAVTFGTYGVLKKRVAARPLASVTAEVLFLAPLALGWLLLFGETGWPGLATFALLVISGPLTALPLMLFSAATKAIRLATVGVLQYLNPTIQFLVAAVILSEPLSFWHAVAFPMIWLALALYSLAALKLDRASRSATTSASTVGTV